MLSISSFKKPLSLSKLIVASEELISFKIAPQDVIFEHDIPKDLPMIVGNFAQLQEVIFNIIDNAHYSMMEKKALVQGDYQPRMLFKARQEKANVVLSVTDNGLGIAPENLKKLFTPLFSTKASSKKGHGLGLYVMKRIIESHGGQISFSSEFGKGVIISIHYPIEYKES